MKRVVMVGSAFDVRGGVSAMARVCDAHGMFDSGEVAYVASHCDGSKWGKLARAARGWLAFARLLFTGRVSLLHAHVNSDASFWRKALFIVPARLLGVPYIVHLHCGAFPDFYRDRCGARAKAFVRWILRGARSVVALSESARQALAAIEPDLELAVIPNPVTLPAWRASLTEGPPTVAFLGMVKEPKGVFELLAAWPRVRAAVPEARLVLGGAGELERARAFAREHGFDDALETPGWVNGADKDAILRRAWVFALPSHWEGMPMSILEAMAAGLPVVATRVGGIPATVEEGRTGRLVDVGDVDALAAALVELLTDPNRRLAMGAAARQRAETEFSADVVVPRIAALWHRGPAPVVRPSRILRS